MPRGRPPPRDSRDPPLPRPYPTLREHPTPKPAGIASNAQRVSYEDEPGFIVEGPGPDGLFGVFEDDGTTGYLYIFDTAREKIATALHIYNRTPALDVRENDMFVTWSSDCTKCGIVIWGDMRGVIDVKRGVSSSVPLRDRSTPGLRDPALLDGFARE